MLAFQMMYNFVFQLFDLLKIINAEKIFHNFVADCRMTRLRLRVEIDIHLYILVTKSEFQMHVKYALRACRIHTAAINQSYSK